MEQGKRNLATTLMALAALSSTAATSRAVVFNEPAADAGQTPSTAAAAGTFNGTSAGLTGIAGTIAGTDGKDADLYSFTLSAATTLRFVASSTAGIDTSLFLFSSTGAPLLANDDQSGTNFQAGFTTTSPLAAGTYYLGISLSGNEAINSASQLLFAQSNSPTALRGPASGLNPATLSTFNGNASIPEGGAYSIAFSAVPEPSTYAALLLGATGLGLLAKRRKLARA